MENRIQEGNPQTTSELTSIIGDSLRVIHDDDQGEC